jgi:hypothetical protein
MQATGMLDEKIDDDGDPATPPLKRRDVYTRLMRLSRDYQAGVSWTWCPNQWAVDVRALYVANRALVLLNSSAAISPEMVQTIVCASIGNDAGTCPMPFPYEVMPWSPSKTQWDPRHQVRKRRFFAPFYAKKKICFPRQAWDKHRKTQKESGVFL